MNSITDGFRPLDEQAVGARVEPHRRGSHVHCYRLLGSFAKRPRRPSASGILGDGRADGGGPGQVCEVTWPQPYPDELLEQLPDRREGPEDVRDGVVTQIVTVDGAVFAHFDLPVTLSATAGAR